jgi:xylitol oxidase
MNPGSRPGPITNWAGNVRFTPASLHEPASVAELQSLVARAARVRALGTGHSFNRIADTTGELVSLRRLPSVADIDAAARTVRVSAGTRYGELGAVLQSAGLALANTGSLPHISVAGAVATGTHGSGVANPILGRAVRAVTMVVTGGDLVTVDRESVGAAFDGHVLALGRLGIVTELVVDVVPTFEVAQTVIVEVSDESVGTRIEQILGAAYSVSIFTTWAPDRNRVWVKARTDQPADWRDRPPWDGRPATGPEHPVAGEPAESATAQLGVPGPWNERLPHFRLDFVPSSGDELQSEYLLPRTDAAAAWAALLPMGAALREVLLAGEIRAVAADSMWLSPTGGHDCVAFHFTWVPDPVRVQPVVAEVERRLAAFNTRPHWGKVFTTTPAELALRYPRLADFRELVARYDPEGRFGNDLVDGWLGRAESAGAAAE